MTLPSKTYQRAGRCLTVVAMASMLIFAACSSDDKDENIPNDDDGEIVITIPGKDGGDHLGPVWDEVTFTIGGNADIANVEVKIDGITNTTITSTPFEVKVNTTNLADGEHSLECIVTLTNGKQTSATVKFTVQNILVEIQAPSAEILTNFPNAGLHYFVFLSDEAGETIAVKEYQPGQKFSLTAPGYTGSTFYLTEVIAYEDKIKDKLITYSQVKRGGKWVITPDIGGGEWFSEWDYPGVAGTARLFFTNPDPDSDGKYLAYVYGSGLGVYTDMPIDLQLTHTPSPLFITKSNEAYGAPTYYKFIPEIRTGDNPEIDLSDVTTPMEVEEITSPYKRLSITANGLAGQDNFEGWGVPAGWLDSKYENGKYKLHFADIFPDYMYYSSNQGDRYEDWNNASRHVYDIEPINATNDIAFDITTRKITGNATGGLDVFYPTIISDFTLWRVMGEPGENRNLVVPKLPEAITKNDVVHADFPMDDTHVFTNVFDIKSIDGYAAFLEGVRNSKKGFNDYIDFGAEYKHRRKIIIEQPE